MVEGGRCETSASSSCVSGSIERVTSCNPLASRTSDSSTGPANRLRGDAGTRCGDAAGRRFGEAVVAPLSLPPAPSRSPLPPPDPRSAEGEEAAPPPGRDFGVEGLELRVRDLGFAI